MLGVNSFDGAHYIYIDGIGLCIAQLKSVITIARSLTTTEYMGISQMKIFSLKNLILGQLSGKSQKLFEHWLNS